MSAEGCGRRISCVADWKHHTNRRGARWDRTGATMSGVHVLTRIVRDGAFCDFTRREPLGCAKVDWRVTFAGVEGILDCGFTGGLSPDFFLLQTAATPLLLNTRIVLPVV